MSEVKPIDKMEARILALQNAHLSLEEDIKKLRHDFENHIEHSALRTIDILDMIDNIKSNLNLEGEQNKDTQFIIKKIEKRLCSILRFWEVQETILKDGQVEVGKTRVLETQAIPGGIAAGTILKVCRKGYQRGEKIIRPADVITVR